MDQNSHKTMAQDNQAVQSEGLPTYLVETYIEPFMRMLAVHDTATAAHCRRVAALAAAVGRALGLDGEMVERVRHAALLHDIGKDRRSRTNPAEAGPIDAGRISSRPPASRIRGIHPPGGSIAGAAPGHHSTPARIVGRHRGAGWIAVGGNTACIAHHCGCQRLRFPDV